MAINTKLKTVKDIGTLPVIVLSPSQNVSITVIGMNLTNITDFPIYASVKVRDDTSIEAYYVKNVIISPNSTLRTVTSGEKLTMPQFYELLVFSDESDSLDAVISYVEII